MTNYEIADVRLEGRQCWVLTPDNMPEGVSVPIVYMADGEDFPLQFEEISKALRQNARAENLSPFAMAAFASTNWNQDYSPWEAPPLSGKAEPFTGGAEETLQWLREAFMPFVEGRLPGKTGPAARALLGYSLGGLFALWASLKTGDFLRCGSCSGSLWYDGFDAYLRASTPPEGLRVYLSLGDREGKARNPRMAAVEPRTREAHAFLEQHPAARETVLRWQPGGHFSDVPQRLADALLWLLR